MLVILGAGNIFPSIQAAELPPAANHVPIVVYPQLATPNNGTDSSSALLGRARELSTLRVLVGLNLELVPSDQLSEAESIQQYARLAEAQDALVERVFMAGEDRIVTRFEEIPYLIVEVSEAELRRLLADPSVHSVQEDGLTAFLLRDSARIIGAKNVWGPKFQLRGTGQSIAILDTGSSHRRMLKKGRIVAGGCYSSNHAGYGSESVCPGGAEEKNNRAAGKNCPEYIDGCDHGTHVATIAAGNSPKLKGVAREANIVRMQVFSRFNSRTHCGPSVPCVMSFTTDQIKALERVYKLRKKHKIAAVNLSLGSGNYVGYCDGNHPAMTDIINRLTDAGVAVVVAGGNSVIPTYGFGYTSYPACIKNAIAVGNSTKRDSVSLFSSYSDQIDLLAPGENIYAGLPGRRYGVMSGTSMAAPHVAGAIALLKSYRPEATVAELVTALSCSGKPLSAAGITKPRIDVRKAYRFMQKNKKSC
jgi:subtilisin family serine protease